MSTVVPFRPHEALREVRGEQVLLARDAANIYRVSLLELRGVLAENRGTFPKGSAWKLSLEETESLGLTQDDWPLVFRLPAIVNLCAVLESERAQEIRADLQSRADTYREESHDTDWDCRFGPSTLAIRDLFANHRVYRSRLSRPRNNLEGPNDVQ